ncbi:protein kinase family protein [Jeotgalibacillus sp. ET6]|uniref:protein kinase family protein n=1 Tax=Jeotgalibacillus sp. ET6 TaxID=3037260 RepID=UPI0024182DD5|nr:protein kinase family protein [Jeotgalibacillus sp. ET6]MDG5472523.1 protein kinase family protein [Jeotgalibacillus sp. ET6]
MDIYKHYADSIEFTQQNGKTVINDHHPDLFISGVGRSAAAFRIRDTELVIKVYFPEFTFIAAEEAEIYKLLTGSRYYPSLHDAGEHYLVIDFVDGFTLFQCLTEGKRIYNRNIEDVDAALLEARNAGLTPSDVHLRNILVTPDGSIKLIDLARFRQVKAQDTQWENLKGGFPLYERFFFPKKIPETILNAVAYLYKKKPGLFQIFFRG